LPINCVGKSAGKRPSAVRRAKFKITFNDALAGTALIRINRSSAAVPAEQHHLCPIAASWCEEQKLGRARDGHLREVKDLNMDET
jgi:hypothetical protein